MLQFLEGKDRAWMWAKKEADCVPRSPTAEYSVPSSNQLIARHDL
jgi:hypothetical protein